MSWCFILSSERSRSFQWKTPDPQLDSSANYIFPEDDLIPHLVDAYFTQINPFLPLLHRPTFEKSIADGLHKTNPLFGGSVMLVCALGSRYSDDPRVFVGDAKNTRSAGWKWFDQVNVLRRSLFERTSLYELQMHAVGFCCHNVSAPFLTDRFSALVAICAIYRNSSRHLDASGHGLTASSRSWSAQAALDRT